MLRVAFVVLVTSLLLCTITFGQEPRPGIVPTGKQEYKSIDGSMLVRVDCDKLRFSLYNAKTRAERWSLPLRTELYCPALVDTSGTVVVTDGVAAFTVLNSTDGSVIGRVNILEQFPGEDKEKYVYSVTDRGPVWEKCSLWGFAAIDSTTFVTLRAWWGRRIVFDCAKRAVVKDEGALHEALDAIDRERLLDRLNEAAKEEPPRPEEKNAWSRVSKVRTLVYWAGALQIKEAVESLRKLERWEHFEQSSGWLSVAEDNPNSPTPRQWKQSTLRQCVQWSLRRLGETPQELPAYQFSFYQNRMREAYTPPRFDGSRADRAHKIGIGMSGRQVLDTLGTPDVIGVTRTSGAAWRHRWEYDIDGPDPVTLVLTWDENHVLSVSRVAPPVWKESRERVMDVLY